MTQGEKILKALGTGAKSIAEICDLTEMTSASASRAAQKLVERGLVVRAGGSSTRFIYGLSGSTVASQGLGRGGIEALEPQYIELRKAGLVPRGAAERLGLTPTAARRFESHYRAVRYALDCDAAGPRFANHDDHIELLAVASFGQGFPALHLPAKWRIAA
jgi:hypothetical protein